MKFILPMIFKILFNIRNDRSDASDIWIIRKRFHGFAFQIFVIPPARIGLESSLIFRSSFWAAFIGLTWWPSGHKSFVRLSKPIQHELPSLFIEIVDEADLAISIRDEWMPQLKPDAAFQFPSSSPSLGAIASDSGATSI